MKNIKVSLCVENLRKNILGKTNNKVSYNTVQKTKEQSLDDELNYKKIVKNTVKTIVLGTTVGIAIGGMILFAQPICTDNNMYNKNLSVERQLEKPIIKQNIEEIEICSIEDKQLHLQKSGLCSDVIKMLQKQGIKSL